MKGKKIPKTNSHYTPLMELRITTSKNGRELEQLIAHLEKILSNSEFSIKSPDYFVDKITGEKREVDISIQGNVGSHHILIIIEVRDRKKRQDVTWIEQLATKRDDIGANKAIAVSAYGFTKGAEKKAELKNIELRTIEQITKENISNWFKASSMANISQHFKIKKALFHPENPEYGKKLRDYLKEKDDKLDSDENILLHEGHEKPISINELFKLIKEKNSIFQDIPLGEKRSINIRLAQENQVDYWIKTKNEPIKIDFIEIEAEIWIEIIYSPIQSVRAYKTSEKTFVQVVTFEDIEISGVKHTVRLLSIPQEGGQKIAFKIEKRNNQP